MKVVKSNWPVLVVLVLAIVGVLLSPHRVRAVANTTTLTGTITDSQGNPINGTLTMGLPVPAVNTTSGVAIAPGFVTYKLLNGVIQSGPPLQDVAALQPSNLYYIAKAYDSAGNIVFAGNYVVTGATFNLGAALPTQITTSNISFLLPVTPNGTNNFTGTNNFAGPTNFTGNVTMSGGQNQLNVYSLDNILYVDGVKFTTIEQALAADNCLGTIVLPPGFTETTVGDIFAGFHSGGCFGKLEIPANATITINGQMLIPNDYVVVMSPGASIVAGASFPTNTALVQLGDVNPFSDASRITGGTLNCNDVSGCFGIYSSRANERSGWDDISINHAPGGCVKFESLVSSNPQNWDMGTLYCLGDSSLSASAIGVYFVGTSGTMISAAGNRGHWTVAGASGFPFAAGVKVNNVTNLYISNLHCESATDCFNQTSSADIIVDNVSGNSSVTNVIHFTNTVNNTAARYSSIFPNGATHALTDDVTSCSITTAGSLTLFVRSGSGVAINTDPNGCDAVASQNSALVSANISNSTSISSTAATSLASVTVAQPASACAWRVVASYAFAWGTGTNQAHVSAALWDGSAAYLPSDDGSSNGTSGGYSLLTNSGPSSVSYSSGTASVTLTLYAESTTATAPTSLGATGVTFGAPISGTVPFKLSAYGACIP